MGDGNLKCVDFATGKEQWSYKGLGGGALMAADGKILMISDRGELVVAEAFSRRASIPFPERRCWAPNAGPFRLWPTAVLIAATPKAIWCAWM